MTTPPARPEGGGGSDACPIQADPGYVSLEVFDQGTWWIDATGTPHRISQISDDYVHNLIEHLTRHHDTYYVALLIAAANDVLDACLHRRTYPEPVTKDPGAPTWWEVTPAEWMESTELMRTLRRRASDRSGVPHKGTWRG